MLVHSRLFFDMIGVIALAGSDAFLFMNFLAFLLGNVGLNLDHAIFIVVPSRFKNHWDFITRCFSIYVLSSIIHDQLVADHG